MKTKHLIITLAVAPFMAASAIAQPTQQMQQLASANNAFACDLYAQLKDTGGNLFFSPFSASSALAMAYAGAKGETAAQMQKALRFPSAQEDKNIHASFAELLKHFDNVQRGGNVQLNIANSLWPQKGAPILESYLALVKQSYGVEITPVDYMRAEPEARARINQWVEEKTREKIKNIIDWPLDPQTRLLLVNAIYFKGAWRDAFSAKLTEIEPFFGGDGSVVLVSLMRQTAWLKYVESSNCQVVEIPYKGDELSMFIALPGDKTPEGLKRLENNLTAEQIAEWKLQMKGTSVQVFLPKFKFTWGTVSLVKSLQKLGVRDAFVFGKADFSGINGNRDFFIGDIFQKAFVAVDEEGTEAAAATAMDLAIGSTLSPPPPPIFRADHPFLFFIQDNATGSILFMGRVVNPAAQ